MYIILFIFNWNIAHLKSEIFMPSYLSLVRNADPIYLSIKPKLKSEKGLSIYRAKTEIVLYYDTRLLQELSVYLHIWPFLPTNLVSTQLSIYLSTLLRKRFAVSHNDTKIILLFISYPINKYKSFALRVIYICRCFHIS